MKQYTYVIMFNVPYDDWEIILVTTNIGIAIDTIKENHRANYIEVWRNERLINSFDFYKDEGINNECFESDMERFISWMKRVGEEYYI